MKCPICLTDMKDGTCPDCGYHESSLPIPEFCEEETGFSHLRKKAAERAAAQNARTVRPARPVQSTRSAESDWERQTQQRSTKKKGRVLALVMVIAVLMNLLPSLIYAIVDGPFESFITEEVRPEPAPVAPALPDDAFGQGSTELDPAEGLVEFEQPVSQVLWDADGLRVEALRFSRRSGGYSFGSSGSLQLGLFLTNTGDRTLNVQFDRALVNGLSADSTVYETLQPQDAFYTELVWDGELLLRSGVHEIGLVEFMMTLHLLDEEGYWEETITAPLALVLGDGSFDAPEKPVGTPVWKGAEDEITISYAGGTGGADGSGELSPTFWFWVENDTDETIRFSAKWLEVDGEEEDWPAQAGEAILPGTHGLVAVTGASYVLELDAESFAELSDFALRFDIDGEETGMYTDHVIELTLAGSSF